MIQQIKACSVCWGSGRTIDGKPRLCGCMPNIVTSKPEDYGLPSYQQLQQKIATLTRQRDLAVEALEKVGELMLCGKKDELPGRCSTASKLVIKAISTIKGSEK